MERGAIGLRDTATHVKDRKCVTFYEKYCYIIANRGEALTGLTASARDAVHFSCVSMTHSARLAKYGPFVGGAVVAPRPLAAIAATRSGGVPQNRIRQVFADLMAPLQALHDESRIHGGISNETIGLDEWGRALLLVPALASARSADDLALHHGRASGFNAFEQYTDDPAWMVGPWTDIYALCAVGCALTTGVAPQSAIDRCVRDDFVPLAERDLKGYEPDFLRVLDAGLTLFPGDRPRSLEAFAATLGVSFELPEPIPLDETQLLRENIAVPARVSVQDPMFHTYGRPGRSRVPLAVGLLAMIVSAALIFFWTRLRWTQTGNWPPATVTAPAEGMPGMRESFKPSMDVAVPGAFVPGVSLSAEPTPGLSGPGSVALAPAKADGLVNGVNPGALAGPVSTQGKAVGGAATVGIAAQAAEGEPSAVRKPTLSKGKHAAAHGPVVAAGASPIEVAVDLRPWGEVYVDGVSHGVSPPLRSVRLIPGRHQITVRNPGAPAYRTSITVRAGKPVSIVHSFR
jgi:hypothetical protein